MRDRAVVRYSEAFKLHVVRAIETGEYETPHAAAKAFGVKGFCTVGRWIRKYGKNHLLRKVVHVMKADERTEVERLRKRVRELEGVLADAQLDLKLERAYVGLACEAAGIEDVDGFKKKHDMGR